MRRPDWLTSMHSPRILRQSKLYTVQNLTRLMGRPKKKAAKSAVSVVSYPELPLPGYELTLFPTAMRYAETHLELLSILDAVCNNLVAK